MRIKICARNSHRTFSAEVNTMHEAPIAEATSCLFYEGFTREDSWCVFYFKEDTWELYYKRNCSPELIALFKASK